MNGLTHCKQYLMTTSPSDRTTLGTELHFINYHTCTGVSWYWRSNIVLVRSNLDDQLSLQRYDYRASIFFSVYHISWSLHKYVRKKHICVVKVYKSFHCLLQGKKCVKKYLTSVKKGPLSPKLIEGAKNYIWIFCSGNQTFTVLVLHFNFFHKCIFRPQIWIIVIRRKRWWRLCRR